MPRRYPYLRRGTGGGSIRTFTLDEDQTKKLLESWGGATQQSARTKKAEGFIPVAQDIVQVWLSTSQTIQKQPTLAKVYRDQVKRYAKAADEFQAAYTDLPDDVFSGVAAFTDGTLFEYGSPRSRLREALADAIGASDIYTGLSGTDPFIKELLSLLSDGAHRTLSNITVPTDINRSAERELISEMAKGYKRYFGKPAGMSSNTPFVKFMATLAEMLGKEIGQKLIEKTLKRRK